MGQVATASCSVVERTAITQATEQSNAALKWSDTQQR
jgi:hypothetical protein